MARKATRQPKPAGAPGSGADLSVLKELIALLESSSVTSLELTRGGASYKVSRLGMPVTGYPPDGAAASGAAGPLAPLAPPASPAPGAAAAAGASAGNLVEIKSPMVGTFYLAPEPGAEPYVRPGSRVAPGQTLCIIEAMKIMNEIESEVAGRIREILVEDAQPVEFGQVLFRVEPNA